MKKLPLIVIAVFLLAIAGMIVVALWQGKPMPPIDDGKIHVLVSIEPQAYFVERIGSNRVVVSVLVPTGQEPETYTPTPKKIREIARSHVFFRVGFPSEDVFVPKLQAIAPNLRIIDTRQSLSLKPLMPHQHVEHAGDDHDHVYNNLSAGYMCGSGGIDPHVWVSPALVKLQAKEILATLVAIDPQHEATYQKNHDAFVADLTALQHEISEKLKPYQGCAIYVYHPTYGYFCDEFGLVQKAIEIDGKSPTPKDIADWIKNMTEENVRLIIVQPEFNKSSVEKIAEASHAMIATHSTLTHNYFQSLRQLTELIQKAYEK